MRRQTGRWPDDQGRRAIELRVGATAPFLQRLHSTTATVGTGRQESLAAGRLVFRGAVRLGGAVRDEDGLGRSGAFEQ